VESAAYELSEAREHRTVPLAIVLALIATLIWGVLIPVQVRSAFA
jgi:hypothetical protein